MVDVHSRSLRLDVGSACNRNTSAGPVDRNRRFALDVQLSLAMHVNIVVLHVYACAAVSANLCIANHVHLRVTTHVHCRLAANIHRSLWANVKLTATGHMHPSAIADSDHVLVARSDRSVHPRREPS